MYTMLPDSPPHLPVMPVEVRELAALEPGSIVIDGTFGAGGHARLLAAGLAGDGTYIGIDRDPSAEARFRDFAEEVAPLATRFLRMPFPDAFSLLLEEGVSADAVILDVGVSSMQLDEPERGFAYAHDAPLDMRMDPSSGAGAAELLATADLNELTRILREYGEEKFARPIAKAIVRRREDGDPITHTADLVEVIRSALPGGGRVLKGGHPAKRTFQALRVAVNDELGMLDRGLDLALELLKPDGRLVVMAFQSLEDRIVKRRIEAWSGSCTCPPGLPVCRCGALTHAASLTRGAQKPTAAEVAENPRSASTRLRAVRRIEPPRLVRDEYGAAL
ncbi:MAG: rsmH [Thermoleophilia bacterium]|nr:rsmH [Thermoleophilia bacterium]MCZ4496094.1 rsmH [Thermoleophilia bacterium]